VVQIVLARLGYKKTAGCGCAEFQAMMNAWKYVGCIIHFREIYRWFKKKAIEQNVSLSPWGLFKELRRAWGEQQRTMTGK